MLTADSCVCPPACQAAYRRCQSNVQIAVPCGRTIHEILLRKRIAVLRYRSGMDYYGLEFEVLSTVIVGLDPTIHFLNFVAPTNNKCHPGPGPGIQNLKTRGGFHMPSSLRLQRPRHLIVWVKLIVELQSHYISAIKASF